MAIFRHIICVPLFSLFLCLVVLESHVVALHVLGKFNTGSFFKFLAKFGFQKTNLKDKSQTQGYIYGNITAHQNISQLVSLTVLDRGKV